MQYLTSSIHWIQTIDTGAIERTTTIEVKTGYGLDLAGEEKLLRVIKISQISHIKYHRQLPGAHAVPPEHPTADDYNPVLLRFFSDGHVR